MIILGHKLIPYSLIYEVSSLEELQNSDFTKDFLFEFNEELLEFSLKNKLSFSLYVKSVKEAIIGNNLNAKFLIVQDLIAAKIQKIAEYYLFDSKIALLAKDDSAIENAAQEGVDALILPPAIIKKGG